MLSVFNYLFICFVVFKSELLVCETLPHFRLFFNFGEFLRLGQLPNENQRPFSVFH